MKEAQVVAKGLGRPSHRIVQVEENIEILPPEEIKAATDKVFDEIASLLAQPSKKSVPSG